MIQWPIHHLFEFSYFKSGYTFRNTSKSTSRKKETKYNVVFVFSYTIMKLEVQYWGQAVQTIKLVDNAYESISGHWDREATRKYLGRQISLFLGLKSQVPLRPFLSLGRGILLLSIPSWMTVTLFRVVLCFAPMMVTVPSLFPAYQNHMSLCQGITCFCEERKLLTYDLYFWNKKILTWLH